MPTETPIEERLSAVEAAIEELRRRMPASSPNWLDQVVGSLKDEPAFDEVLAYGRAFREADRPGVQGDRP
ncbi:hypothetical protein AB1L88_20540 [Tautonia sp. JC769]|uniref:hypothetical protein n=1 Tax=Tautonia sp. JC769 TaxID=3232135 RepID=UPI00345B071B